MNRPLVYLCFCLVLCIAVENNHAGKVFYQFYIHEEHEDNSNETDTNSTKKEPKVNITGSWLSSFLLPGKDFESEDAFFVERSDFTYDEDGYHTEYNISEFPHDLDTRLGPKVLKVVTG